MAARLAPAARNEHTDGRGGGLFTDEEWARLAAVLYLSPREVEILRLVIADRKELAIARALEISPHTVHTHLGRVYRKVGANGRLGAVVAVFKAYLSLAHPPDG